MEVMDSVCAETPSLGGRVFECGDAFVTVVAVERFNCCCCCARIASRYPRMKSASASLSMSSMAAAALALAAGA